MKPIPILNIEQFEHEEPFVDFYCNDLSQHLKNNDHIIHKPHRHDFFLCVLFSEGSGIHEIDFTSYSINPGSVFFLKPGQIHNWKFNSTPKGYIFFHTQDFYELYFSNNKLIQFPFYASIVNPPNLTLQRNELSILEKHFKELYTEYNNKTIYKKQKLTCLINLIYIDLARIYTISKPTNSTLSLTYFKTLITLEQLIEEFYITEKSASYYANQLHITTKHLSRITKAVLNKTTTDLIIERNILEAKRLIINSNDTLTAIAELLGYEDYAYFSKIFKSKVKVSPLKFKK